LQRWVSKKAVEEGWALEPAAKRKPASGRRVAVLGAGPAGISAASLLATLGHHVVLFDRGSAFGGVAQQTIPADRLPETVMQREARDVLASSGVAEYRPNTRLGDGSSLSRIMAEGFDAALLALGLGKSVPLSPERPPDGVEGALQFLSRVKQGDRVAGTVLVLGGGNTAIDAALSALHAGATDVAIVYRRSFAEMPAWPEERDRAVRAGVHFLILTAPLGYVRDEAGRLSGLRVARTRLGEPDASGRRRPLEIPGSEHVLPADRVVEAIGQQLDDATAAALEGVDLVRGLVKAAPLSMATSRPGVYAAGDIVNGGSTVVQAVAEGARAARAIDAFLKGEA
jgi:formate dehydrogenase major subunit